MAITVRLEGPLLRIDGTGTLCTEDFRQLAAEVIVLERQLGYAPNRIADLSRLERIEIGFTDLDALAQRRQQVKAPNRFRSAIVAPRPGLFGVARMFQSLSVQSQHEVEIFPSLDAALAWVNEDPAHRT